MQCRLFVCHETVPSHLQNTSFLLTPWNLFASDGQMRNPMRFSLGRQAPNEGEPDIKVSEALT